MAENRRGMLGTSRIRAFGCALGAIALLSLPCFAQLQVGDDLRMNLSGNVGFTYAGGMNGGVSDHAMGFMGNGTLSGNYYNPNFLNFNVSPFYNREQTNSIFGSLSNSSGLSSNVNLFSGSHFPGSISYNKLFNDTNAFGVPGSDLGLAQRQNTQSFGVGWSALIPDWPTLTANYTIGNTSNDLIGIPGTDTENDRLLNIMSTYNWDGFLMTGQFQHRTTDTYFSELLETGQSPFTTLSSSNDYGATLQHSLPMTGSFGLSWNRLSYNYDYQNAFSANNSGNSDTVNATAAFHPTNQLGVSFEGTYNDSLLGNVPVAALNAGTAVNTSVADSFHSYLVGSNVFYQVITTLGLQASVAYENQSFLGQSYSATQFGGSANFNFDHSLVKGLSFSVGVVDTAQQANNTGVGFVGNVNYDRKFWGWDLGANFSYAQNVQTVMLVYTTSYYSYLGSVRRRIGDRKYFMAGYSGSHSGVTANSGTTSSANRVWSGFIYRGNSINAYYDKSSGLALFTAAGLVPVPTTLPTQVLAPNTFTSYDSTGYGVSLGITPMRRLIVSGAWAKSNGSTISPSLNLYTDNTLINATMQYRLRKIFVTAGYTRLNQSIGALGTQPLDVTNYYIGISRWFNFF